MTVVRIGWTLNIWSRAHVGKSAESKARGGTWEPMKRRYSCCGSDQNAVSKKAPTASSGAATKSHRARDRHPPTLTAKR